jgi:hypothetical protein
MPCVLLLVRDQQNQCQKRSSFNHPPIGFGFGYGYGELSLPCLLVHQDQKLRELVSSRAMAMAIWACWPFSAAIAMFACNQKIQSSSESVQGYG